ncbi:MAG: hypothetical protein WCQ21_10935 [Verrucomicrobiota bacterium]
MIALNIGTSNNPYERKKAAYDNSALRLTNSLRTDWPEFGFAQVIKGRPGSRDSHENFGRCPEFPLSTHCNYAQFD